MRRILHFVDAAMVPVSVLAALYFIARGQDTRATILLTAAVAFLYAFIIGERRDAD